MAVSNTVVAADTTIFDKPYPNTTTSAGTFHDQVRTDGDLVISSANENLKIGIGNKSPAYGEHIIFEVSDKPTFKEINMGGSKITVDGGILKVDGKAITGGGGTDTVSKETVTAGTGIEVTATKNPGDNDRDFTVGLDKATQATLAKVAVNEANIAKNTQAIDKNKTDIAGNTNKITTNEGNITKNTQAIDKNKTDIAGNTNKITTNEGNITKNTQAIDKNKADIAKKANKSLDNIDDAGKDVITALTDVEAGTNVTSVDAKVDPTTHKKTYKVNVADMRVKSGTANYNPDGTGSITVTNGDKSTANITGLKDTKVTGATLTGDTLSIAQNGGEKDITVDLASLKANLTDGNHTTIKGTGTQADPFKVNVVTGGKVEKDDKGIVTGGTIFSEVRVNTDGNYIKKDNTASKNLVALDKQVKVNEDNIAKKADLNLGNIDNAGQHVITALGTELKAGDNIKLTTETDKTTGKKTYTVAADIKDGHITENKLDQNLQNKINQTTNIRKELNEVRDDVDAVGAMGAALAALKPLQYDPTEKTQIMAGIGRYKHHNAYALGLAVHSNEDLLLNGGISFSKGRTLMVNAGVTWRVGTDARKDMPKIYRRGPITAMYEMTKVIVNLQDENKTLRDKNAKQDDEIYALKIANAKQNEEMKEIKAQLAALMAKNNI